MARVDVDHVHTLGSRDGRNGVAGPDSTPRRSKQPLALLLEGTRVGGYAADARGYIIMQRTVILVAGTARALDERRDVDSTASEPHTRASQTQAIAVHMAMA